MAAAVGDVRAVLCPGLLVLLAPGPLAVLQVRFAPPFRAPQGGVRPGVDLVLPPRRTLLGGPFLALRRVSVHASVRADLRAVPCLLPDIQRRDLPKPALAPTQAET